jgi:hypothetical protein
MTRMKTANGALSEVRDGAIYCQKMVLGGGGSARSLDLSRRLAKKLENL